jgi:ArsR family transcriptional regulator, arsenate/arsenite/antimonite-responsive transcriptional repressor
MPRNAPALIDPDVQLLQALAHPTRLAILRELTATSEVCACDFTSCCDVRQPTVSHHLKILKEAGVIAADRRGTSIFYRLEPAAADRLRALAGELLGGPQVIPATTLAGGRQTDQGRPESRAQPTV